MKTRTNLPITKVRPTRKHAHAGARTPRHRLRKILVPVDFSTASRKVLRYARGLAQRHGACLALVNVVKPIVFHANYGYGPVVRHIPDEAAIKRAQTRLNGWRTQTRRVPQITDCIVRSGIAFFEIAEAARQADADLVVVGARTQTGGSARELGGTADKVIRHAPCPVLVVHDRESEVEL